MGHKCLLVFSGISKTIPDLRKLYSNVCKELDRVLETPTFLLFPNKKKRNFLLGIWGHGDHGGYHRRFGRTQYFFVLLVEDLCDALKEEDLETAISAASSSCWSYDEFHRHLPSAEGSRDDFVKDYTEPGYDAKGRKPQIGKLSEIQRQAAGMRELGKDKT